jgi:hypothetical protein
MRKTVAVLCAGVFALSACGGSGEDDQAKDAIKASVMENATSVAGGAELSDEQAECFADGIVDEVGVEKLQEYELLDDDLGWVDDADPTMSEADAEASAEVITGCVDLGELMMEQVNADADSDLTEEQAECISDALDDGTMEEFLAASLQGDDSSQEELSGALLGCVMAAMGDLGESQ